VRADWQAKRRVCSTETRPNLERRSRSRFAPLLYAGVAFFLGALTFGAGLVASLPTFPLSLFHLRRLPPPRGFAFWLGVVINGAFAFATLYVLVALLVTGQLF
jgi:hypothetical protein